MKKNLALCLLFIVMLAGCGAASKGGSVPESSAAVSSAGGNDFNPFMNSKLPNLRPLSDEGQKMLGSMGGKAQSIEGEAAHRKNWRDEIYPVVFGNRNAPQEILVVIDFAKPESAKVWQQVGEASRSINPDNCKIAVFGKSSENYGTDLMGLAIWLAHSRPGQAMPYLSYALNAWNDVKGKLASKGIKRKFTNEYDATASAKDFPIHFAYLSRINPPIPQSQELQVGKYCWDAGSVNMYQANQICQYYGVKSVPAVIVNGKVLGNPSASSILAALK